MNRNPIFILGRLNMLIARCEIAQDLLDDAKRQFYDEPELFLLLELKQLRLDIERERIEQAMIEIPNRS